MPTVHRTRSIRFGGRPLLLAVLGVMGTLMLAVGVGAFPKPAAIPFRWQLSFDPGPFRLYEDPIDGSHYWFFTYTITNLTGRDRIWAPNLVLFTDVGEILSAGRGVPTRIEESIRDLLGNELLEVLNEVIGDVRQGREHARDSFAVWPAGRTRVNEMSMFIGGLSGETARVVHPVTGDEVILRKTLQRNYLVPGDARRRGTKPIELVSQRWVLR